MVHQLRLLCMVLVVDDVVESRVWVVAVGRKRPQRGIAVAAVDPLCQRI